MLPATITKIQQTFKEIKYMQCDTWEGDYRPTVRDALKDILEHRMGNAVDAYLEQKRAEGCPDRRNGSYPRHLLTELGDLGLRIPRTRTFSARVLLQRLARRAFSIERLGDRSRISCLFYQLRWIKNPGPTLPDFRFQYPFQIRIS